MKMFYYTVHNLIYIESNKFLDLSKLLPTITTTEYRKHPNIKINVSRKINMDTSKLIQLGNYWSSPNLGFIYHQNKIHRRNYNFQITDIMSNTVIRTTKSALPTLYNTINTIIKIKLNQLSFTHVNATFIQTPSYSSTVLISPLPHTSSFHKTLIQNLIQNKCTILHQGTTLISQDGTFLSYPRTITTIKTKKQHLKKFKNKIKTKLTAKVTTLTKNKQRESAEEHPISKFILLSPFPYVDVYKFTTKISQLNHTNSPNPLHVYAYFNDSFNIPNLDRIISTCILQTNHSSIPFSQDKILEEVISP